MICGFIQFYFLESGSNPKTDRLIRKLVKSGPKEFPFSNWTGLFKA